VRAGSGPAPAEHRLHRLQHLPCTQ
jgi:hypothetical protein